ncbi:unnamed protein product, partial [Onchocerca ochengi]|uniref:Apple domain-containing protein n=1 Tax=Onchocerca ochengi TaxID=42157 RepID=A0A182EPF6_ONCOC
MLIESLCSRFHKNTAYLGAKPIFSLTVSTIRQCRDTCLDLYPYCVAVIFYQITILSKPLCYLFDKNSIHKDVVLYPEKPLAKHDIINTIEIVADCHEFDAVPPLSDTFTTSSDKVSRARRASNIGNPIKRNGLWTSWTKCDNSKTRYQIRSQSCEYGRIIQKRQCSNKSSFEISPFPYSSPFHPYPPEPYEHPDDKSLEYQYRLAEHLKQLQKSRIYCCKRQEWYREHVNKNYIEICRHSCPPSDLLNIERNFDKPLYYQQQQFIPSKESSHISFQKNRIQEYKGQTEEIMSPLSVSSIPAYETNDEKNEQEQSIVKKQLSSWNDKSSLDLPQEVRKSTKNYQKDKAINHMIVDEQMRKHEEEYFHQLQSQQDKITDESLIKPNLINDKEKQAHRTIISQGYYRHNEHDDNYQPHQQRIQDDPQQDEFVNEHGGTFEENHYQEHNRDHHRVPTENGDAGESEFDGNDYGYDYDNQDETPITVNHEQTPTQEIANSQFPHQIYPYDTRDETSTVMSYLYPDQESYLNQSEHVQHHLIGSLVEKDHKQQQEQPYHLGASFDDQYRQEEEQQELSKLSPEDYHRELETQPQPSGIESDEYYHRQQVQPQPSEFEIDENNRLQQQQEFSTLSPEDYRREQESQSQLSESEFDEYYRGQQAQPQSSESEFDEYNRLQQQQEFSTLSPEDYRREQESQPQLPESELDEYYRQQQ